jgi:hypothetical protein
VLHYLGDTLTSWSCFLPKETLMAEGEHEAIKVSRRIGGFRIPRQRHASGA